MTREEYELMRLAARPDSTLTEYELCQIRNALSREFDKGLVKLPSQGHVLALVHNTGITKGGS